MEFIWSKKYERTKAHYIKFKVRTVTMLTLLFQKISSHVCSYCEHNPLQWPDLRGVAPILVCDLHRAGDVHKSSTCDGFPHWSGRSYENDTLTNNSRCKYLYELAVRLSHPGSVWRKKSLTSEVIITLSKLHVATPHSDISCIPQRVRFVPILLFKSLVVGMVL